MDHILRDAVEAALGRSGRKKKVALETLLDAVKRLPVHFQSDFDQQHRLLETLDHLARDGQIRLPSTHGPLWDRQRNRPFLVYKVASPEEAKKKREHREKIDRLRNQTSWEPTRMASFAHRLKTLKELECAAAVNRYLVQRSGEMEMIPHRERALEIFGDEKALDHSIHGGLFKGRITLADLDCFYCPEPLPFHWFSLDAGHTRGKPLLVVENANTYWSCCRANERKQQFSAVVYGQGFAVCAAQRASDGLMEIQGEVGAQGLHYFGDLDPTGLAIARRIDGYRREKGLLPLLPETRLYRALLKKNRSTPYDGSQAKDYDPLWARQWLGQEIAETYLKHANRLRWPQEGLTAREISAALSPFKFAS